MDRYLISHRGESHDVLEHAYTALMYDGAFRARASPNTTPRATKEHTVHQLATDRPNQTT